MVNVLIDNNFIRAHNPYHGQVLIAHSQILSWILEVANEIEDYRFYYDVESNLVDIDTRNDLVITTTHSTTAFTSVRAFGIKINN